MNTEIIQDLLYNKSLKDAKNILSSCTAPTMLHIYAFNYNWDDGFDLPQTIIDNPVCALSTALMIFYLGDGYLYLSEKNKSSNDPDWLFFISNLYNRIYNNAFTNESIEFTVPLSKAQIFKLKKQLNENEQVFITPIEGNNYDISL
ncbi:MAG: DUF4274 domain-containing protein [Eubacterium sp.]|nr:DUF4274 domain-containing protein [Eubacterium sp.]